jgi:hypothetical protein
MLQPLIKSVARSGPRSKRASARTLRFAAVHESEPLGFADMLYRGLTSIFGPVQCNFHRRGSVMSVSLWKNVIFLVIATGDSSFATADVLYLTNGDRITGDIKRIWDGEVNIEPEYSDEFQVDLPLVKRIESDRDFEVEMPDGPDVVAKIKGTDESGNQLFIIDGESVAVPLRELHEVDEPDDFYDWDVLVDYGLSVNDGNTDSLNSPLSGEGMFKHGDHRHIGKITQILEDLDGTTTKDQTLLAYS